MGIMFDRRVIAMKVSVQGTVLYNEPSRSRRKEREKSRDKFQ
jgi:hypothetical protein